MNAPRSFAGSCLAVLLVSASIAPAQQPAPSTNSPASEGSRYLFAMDTSRSMKPRLDATLSLIDHLITSGMDGRLRRGDTIGLWKFANKLESGAFPLQVWIPERRQQISLAIVSHLKETRFSGSTDLREPLNAALELVKESDSLTILFLTDGEVPFRGTPFDAELNTAIKLAARPMRSAGLPFAVFLVGRGGKLTDYAVNSAFKPLAYPPVEVEEPKAQPVPAEAAKSETFEPKPPSAEAKPQTESKPPELAVSPRAPTDVKTVPATQSEPTNTVPVQPEFIVPTAGPTQTNALGSVILPQPVPTAVVEPPPPATSAETRTEPARPIETVAATRPAQNLTTTETPGTAESRPDSNQLSARLTITNPPAENKPVASAPSETPAPQLTKATATAPVETAPTPVTNAPAPTPIENVPQAVAAPVDTISSPSLSETKPPKPEESVVAPTPAVPEPVLTPAAAVVATTAPPAIVLSARTETSPLISAPSSGHSTVSAEVSSESKPADVPSPAPAPSAPVPTNAPVPVLAVIPPESGYSSRALLVTAFTLLGVAGGLSLLLLRRRVPAGASIITRSLDHEKH